MLCVFVISSHLTRSQNDFWTHTSENFVDLLCGHKQVKALQIKFVKTQVKTLFLFVFVLILV